VRFRRLEYTVNYHEFATDQATELFAREGPAHPYWLAVSPDERWILYSEISTPESELMLVENFR
jgi:hypothetical protein